jgi:hypothetical protein
VHLRVGKKTLTTALAKVEWNRDKLPNKSKVNLVTFLNLHRQTNVTNKLKL